MVLKKLGEVALFAELPEDEARILVHVGSEQRGNVGIPRHPWQTQHPRLLLKLPPVTAGNRVLKIIDRNDSI